MKQKNFLSALLACLFLLLFPVQQVWAMEDGIVLTEEVTKLASGSYADFSEESFETTDLRTGKKVTFDGGDGTYSIFLFGGIGTCGYTNDTIAELSELVESVDMTKLQIYLIDIKDNSTETIVKELTDGNISKNLYACNYEDVKAIYSKSYRAVGLYSYTMPFMVYVNADGEMYSYTTGSATIKKIVDNLNEGGLEVNYDFGIQTFYVNGKSSYTYAYEVLDLVNQARQQNGLSAISMDKELLEAAMQRAAECAVSFDHTRPNGEICFELSEKMSRENIAAGYSTPEAVMKGWLNSSGHYANIMGSDNLSVGIGCVQVNGRWYWAQCFGRVEPEVTFVTGEYETTYAIPAGSNFVPKLEEDSFVLESGDTGEIRVNSGRIFVNNNSWNWSSSNTKVATVDANGVITAKSGGVAVITGTNIGTKANPLTVTVSVTGGNADDYDITGLAEASDGKWYYYVNGEVDYTFNGLYCDANVGWWLVRNGEVAFDYTGLYNDAELGWWLIGGGAVCFDYNGLWGDSQYGWWKITGGTVDFGYTGLYCDAAVGWWLIGGGAVCFDYNGLWGDPIYGWWKVAGGAVDFGYTGLYCDAAVGWWLVGGGAVCFDYSGLWGDPVYGWWYVEGGAINFGYTGYVNYNGVPYAVVNGKLA